MKFNNFFYENFNQIFCENRFRDRNVINYFRETIYYNEYKIINNFISIAIN